MRLLFLKCIIVVFKTCSFFFKIWTELRCGKGQPEDSGGEDESSAPQPEQRSVAAQEEPRLPQQNLSSALQ